MEPQKMSRIDEAAARLEAWAIDSGVRGLHQDGVTGSAVCLRASENCGGMGVFATSSISAGAIELTLPRHVPITHLTCCRAIPALERYRVPEFTSFVLFLMHQWHYGVEASCRPDYLAALPAPGSLSGGLTTALTMSAERIAALPESYARACNQVRRRAEASWSCADDFVAKLPPEEAIPFRDVDLRTWATSIIISRCFSIHGRMMLLPIIDTHNNSNFDGCDLQYNSSGNVLVRTNRKYAPGEEIFLRYGGDDPKPDEELLANYGYSNVLKHW